LKHRSAGSARRKGRTPMSLIAMLEGCKEVAMAERERLALQNAEEIAEFEEHGADLAAAFNEMEISAAEEALRLGEDLDQAEETEAEEQMRRDLEMARDVLEAEESTAQACVKDEDYARQIDAELQKEALRVAKLERRERQLAEKKLCKEDWDAAARLAEEIEAEEAELRRAERRDRKLAQSLVRDEGKVLATLPKTEEKLRTLSRSINGCDGTIGGSMRMRLRARLSLMR